MYMRHVGFCGVEQRRDNQDVLPEIQTLIQNQINTQVNFFYVYRGVGFHTPPPLTNIRNMAGLLIFIASGLQFLGTKNNLFGVKKEIFSLLGKSAETDNCFFRGVGTP